MPPPWDCIFTQCRHGGPGPLDLGHHSSGTPIRIIRRAPDRVTDFGAGRFVSDTTVVDVRIADLPAPRPGDLIVIGADSHVIQGEPLRDRERLIWTLDLRPA